MHKHDLRSDVELQNARNRYIKGRKIAVMFQRGWLLPSLR